ncbi:MAG: ABC transporter permease [Myxococcota bacterium]|nr:ABC transporter permease [Myxococcota bacterium]
MSGIAKTGYFWRSAAQGLRHAPFVHFIAVLTIAIALFSAGLVRTATRLVDDLVATLGGQVRVTVYLTETASPEELEAVRSFAATRSGGTARTVSPQEALERLRSELGEVGDALGALPANPLPASVELEVPAANRGAEQLRTLSDALRAMPSVNAVDYGEEAVERLSAIARALRYGGLAAWLIVALATVVIVSATLQLAIYARREEIEIQKLVGATDRFVKAPFLLEGLLQGVLGAAVALGGLAAFALLVGPRLAQLFAFLVGPSEPSFVTGQLVLETLAAGAGLGLAGSFVAVGRFLRV